MSDIGERLLQQVDYLPREVRQEAAAEIERHMREKVELAGLVAKERSEVERLRAALQAITDECKTDPANPYLADDMDRIARAALEPKP